MPGERIKNARIALGLSQEALAQGICSRSHISGIEAGKVRPTIDILKAIVDRLHKPLSHFVPDRQEELAQQMKTLLNQIKGYLAIGYSTEAETLFRECKVLHDSSLSAEIAALYQAVLAELQRERGDVLEATVSTMSASEQYLGTGCRAEAFDCMYGAAFGLYKMSHIDYAISIAHEALRIAADAVDLVEQVGRTHYLLGCCYAALGDAAGAHRHFDHAEKQVGSEVTEMGIKSLIAKASCLGRQGDWPQALELSQKAADLTDRKRYKSMRAEALIGASISLARMQEVDRAEGILAELMRMEDVEARLKRKAYREMILTLSDMSLLEACIPYEAELQRLLPSPEFEEQNWETVKDRWALAKCGLLRDPHNIMEQIESFTQEFLSLMRYKDAADAMVFGAELLVNQNQPEKAYNLLKAAWDLQIRRTPDRNERIPSARFMPI